MANKKAAAKEVATEVAAQTTTEQAVAAAAETTTEQDADATAETPAEDATADKAKRERNYSQTAIDKGDLERLNAFKAHIKETRKLNVSNQTIIAAALDCLAANMEDFLKKLVAEASDKSRAKDLKAFEALKAKLEKDGAFADTATETTTEEA